MSLTTSGTTVTASDYAEALSDGTWSAYNGTTLQLAFTGACGAAINAVGSGAALWVANGEDNAAGKTFGGSWPYYNVVVGRTWPADLQWVYIDMTAWSDGPSQTVNFLDEVSGEVLFSWNFTFGGGFIEGLTLLRGPLAAGALSASGWDQGADDLTVFGHNTSDAKLVNLFANVFYRSAADSALTPTPYFSASGGMCFAPTAGVAMADGSVRAIADVCAGDAVASVNMHEAARALKECTRACR